jgi:hypothetical protein
VPVVRWRPESAPAANGSQNGAQNGSALNGAANGSTVDGVGPDPTSPAVPSTVGAAADAPVKKRRFLIFGRR